MSSGYGVYWFKWNELKIIKDESRGYENDRI